MRMTLNSTLKIQRREGHGYMTMLPAKSRKKWIAPTLLLLFVALSGGRSHAQSTEDDDEGESGDPSSYCGTCPDACREDGGGSPSSGSPPPPPRSCNGSAACLAEQAGMPSWLVSEPGVNVWLTDTPLRYKTSRGRSVAFKLHYKNRQGTQGTNDNGEPRIFSVGSRWHTGWRSYVQPVVGESTNFWVFVGNGTARKYTLDRINYANRAKLVQTSGTNVLQFPNGARNVYGLSNTLNGVTRYFLTRLEDAEGNGLQFEYLVTNDTIRLEKVLDVDNRAITFEYASAGSYSNVITKVIGPHGLTNILRYDASGRLTNIVDVIGLSSSMQYDSTNVTALITPYGTNTFTYFSISTEMFAVRVAELTVRKHLYLYRSEVDGGKVPNNYLNYLPNTTNAPYFSIANTFDGTNSHLRNSFHWNPRQYEGLSDLIRTNLDNGNFNVSNLTAADYLKGRQNHWLKNPGGANTSRTLSLKRAASPDGTLQGQIDWFDYAGKEATDIEGTMFLPRLRSVKLPNGECRFKGQERNEFGHATNKVETYTDSGGSCQVRTNQYFYASNNIDLIRHVQFLGSTTRQISSNAFNSAHQVLTNVNALGEMTIHTYNAKAQLLSTRLPSGLTRSNVYETSGPWSNFVTKKIELEFNATNSLSYSNGYVLGFTNARGLARTFSRDALGRLTRTEYPDGSSIVRAYDKLLNFA